MATANPAEPSRHRFDRVRGMDHLEAGVRNDTKRLPGARGARLYGSKRPGSNHIHPLRAWLILAFITLNLGAFAAILVLCWQH